MPIGGQSSDRKELRGIVRVKSRGNGSFAAQAYPLQSADIHPTVTRSSAIETATAKVASDRLF